VHDDSETLFEVTSRSPALTAAGGVWGVGRTQQLRRSRFMQRICRVAMLAAGLSFGCGGSSTGGSPGSGGAAAGSAGSVGTAGTTGAAGSMSTGTAGTGGSGAGGSGAGGSGTLSCTFTQSGTLSPMIATVGIVTWSTTLAGVQSAKIDFGLTT